MSRRKLQPHSTGYQGAVAEAERSIVRRKPPSDLTAYEFYLLRMEAKHGGAGGGVTKEGLAEAERLFRRDSRNRSAAGESVCGLGLCLRVSTGVWPPRLRTIKQSRGKPHEMRFGSIQQTAKPSSSWDTRSPTKEWRTRRSAAVRQIREVCETRHRSVRSGLRLSGGGKRHDRRHGRDESRRGESGSPRSQLECRGMPAMAASTQTMPPRCWSMPRERLASLRACQRIAFVAA